MRPTPARALPAAAALAAVLTAATACAIDTGGPTPADTPASASPTPSPAPSPTPSTRAEPGVTDHPQRPVVLAPGEPASLALASAGGARARMEVAVTDVTRGDISDLSGFELGPAARRSTPYYADVAVTSTARTSPAVTQVPLWGLDSEGTVRPPADVIGTFRRCQPQPLPEQLGRGETVRTCLTYLLPRGTDLEAVQYRFNNGRPPFTWPVR
jgi:hypothetical protein